MAKTAEKHRYVVFAAAKRRNGYWNVAETEIQVLSEVLFPDHLDQIFVSCRYYSYVYVNHLVTAKTHAAVNTDHPVKQGLLGAFEVFIDTIVICSLTALVVIVTGYWDSGLQGATLTLTAFQSVVGPVARIVIACSIFLFGLTTSTGWFTYYQVLLDHWLKGKDRANAIASKILLIGTPLWGFIVTVLTVYANGTPAQLWVVADFSTVFPTFFNVATLLMLSGTFIKLLKDYKARYLHEGTVDPDFKLFYEDKIKQNQAKKEA